MADYERPIGRRTIRARGPASTDPMRPQGRPNAVIKFWELGEAAKGTTKAKLLDAYQNALSAVDRTEARAADAAKSGRFTPEGAKQDVRSFVFKEAVPALKRGRVVIEAAKREAAGLRAGIKLQPPDKSDFVGALHRAELRDFLRNKPKEERDQYIGRNLDRLDPQMALAIMELGHDVVGVSELQRKVIMDRALEAQHGDALRQLNELERAIETAESAVEAGKAEMVHEAGYINRADFERDAAPYEAKAGVPWLKKDGDRTIVVDLERNVGRAPTAEELDTGHFFADYAEYQRANGLTAAA